jgi:class 3 adenylate cyclase
VGTRGGGRFPLRATLHRVGKVGIDGVNQVTALGDVVNTAARIQALAGAARC